MRLKLYITHINILPLQRFQTVVLLTGGRETVFQDGFMSASYAMGLHIG